MAFTSTAGLHHGLRNKAVTRLLFLAATLFLTIFGIFGLCPAQTPEIEPAPVVYRGPLDFKELVRIALVNSPLFVRSSLEIDVQSLRESDAKWSYIPSIVLNTKYYMNTPDDTDKKYQIEFNSGAYNPLVSFFSVKASKLITQAANLAHLRVLSEGIYKLAEMLIKLEVLGQREAFHRGAVTAAREQLAFARKLEAMGATSPLESQMALQELELLEAEAQELTAAQDMLLESLAVFLGLETVCPGDLDMESTKDQIIGDFDPVKTTYEQVREKSWEIRAYKYKEKLQEKKILLAKAKYMPNFNFGVRTQDPLSETSGDNELYVSLNFNLLLWDGFKRKNDVTREKLILRQYEAETKEKKINLLKEWREAQAQLRRAATGLKLARSAQRLAELRERQTEIEYKSGGKPLSDLLRRRLEHVSAKKKTLEQLEAYDLAHLRIRHLSGDLFEAYVSVAPFEE